MRLNITIKGVEGVQKRLDQIKQRSTDWTQAAPSLHAYLIRRMDRNFQTEGRSEGITWPKYGAEPKYRAFKRAMVGHLDVLRWEKGGKYERLYPSLTNQQHADHVWSQEGRTTMKYGTTVPYAGSIEQDHQGPFGEISPAREWSHIGRTTTDGVVEIVRRWILLGKVER